MQKEQGFSTLGMFNLLLLKKCVELWTYSYLEKLVYIFDVNWSFDMNLDCDIIKLASHFIKGNILMFRFWTKQKEYFFSSSSSIYKS